MHILAQIADNILDRCTDDDRRILLQDPVELSGNVLDCMNQKSFDSASFCSFVLDSFVPGHEHPEKSVVHHHYYLSKGRIKIPIDASYELEPKPYALVQNTSVEDRVIELTGADSKWLKLKFLDSGTFTEWRLRISKALVEQLCVDAFQPLPSGRLSSVRLGKALQTCHLLTEPTDFIVQRTKHLQQVRERMTETLKQLRSSPHDVSSSSIAELIELGKTEPILSADPDMIFLTENLNAEAMSTMSKQQLEDVCKRINYDELEEIEANDMSWEPELRCMKSPEAEFISSSDAAPAAAEDATPTTATVLPLADSCEKSSRAHRRSLCAELTMPPSACAEQEMKAEAAAKADAAAAAAASEKGAEMLLVSAAAIATAVPVAGDEFAHICPDVQFWQDHRTAARMSSASSVSTITAASVSSSKEPSEQMQSLAGRGKMCIKLNGKELLSSARKRKIPASELASARKTPAKTDSKDEDCTQRKKNKGATATAKTAALGQEAGPAAKGQATSASAVDENHNAQQQPMTSKTALHSCNSMTPKRRVSHHADGTGSVSRCSSFKYTDRRKALTPRAPRSSKKAAAGGGGRDTGSAFSMEEASGYSSYSSCDEASCISAPLHAEVRAEVAPAERVGSTESADVLPAETMATDTAIVDTADLTDAATPAPEAAAEAEITAEEETEATSQVVEPILEEPAVSLTLSCVGVKCPSTSKEQLQLPTLEQPTQLPAQSSHVLTPELLRDGRKRLVQRKKCVGFNSSSERFPSAAAAPATVASIRDKSNHSFAAKASAAVVVTPAAAQQATSMERACGAADDAYADDAASAPPTEAAPPVKYSDDDCSPSVSASVTPLLVGVKEAEDKSTRRGFIAHQRLIIGLVGVVAAALVAGIAVQQQTYAPQISSIADGFTSTADHLSSLPEAAHAAAGGAGDWSELQLREEHGLVAIEDAQGLGGMEGPRSCGALVVPEEPPRELLSVAAVRKVVSLFFSPIRGAAFLVKTLLRGLQRVFARQPPIAA